MANTRSSSKVNNAKKTSAKTSQAKKSSSAKKSSTSKKATPKKPSSSAKKGTTRNVTVEADVIDVKKVEATKEILLWVMLAVCILLFLSNLGIGGTIGNAISGFFFGVFGLLAYLLPLLLIVATFFGISNYGSNVAVIKIVSGSVFALFLATFLELVAHGDATYGAVRAFYYGREQKAGGGFFGGLLADGLVSGFGLICAYVITIVVLIICGILVSERTLIQGSRNRRHHRARRSTNPAESREDRRARILKDKSEQEAAFDADDSLPRHKRKISGVSFDTSVSEDVLAAGGASDELGEIKRAPEEDIEVSDVSRVQLLAEQSGSTSRVRSPRKIFMADTKEQEDNALNQVNTESIIALESDAISATHAVMRRTTADAVQRDLGITGPFDSHSESADLADIETQQEEAVAPVRKARKTIASTQEVNASASEVASSIAKEKRKAKTSSYHLPPLSLLTKKAAGKKANSKEQIEATADKLEQTLRNFGINVEVTDVTCGPTVTRYELLPEAGVRVNRITNLADDIKLNLAVTDIRIEAPIPGKSAVGIEVPNKDKVMVSFEELASSKEFKNSESKVTFCAGRDIAGNVITANIAKMPHLLIAGTTGSGKSVCINTIIMSILYKARPDEVKFIMIDPKVVELSIYNGIPHLLIPVVTEPKKAAGALHWAVTEMDDRYQKFADASVRDIKSYNRKLEENNYQLPINSNGELGTFERMPEMVVIVDELADLMMVAAKEVEESICRLAQKARAAGIYLILATQRPSVDVVTGLIKANMPSRIAFAVNSGVDSRTILDMFGAEKLLGNGDMLYYPQGYTKPLRVQGAFVSDQEVSDVVDYIKGNSEDVKYDDHITQAIESKSVSGANATAIDGGNGFEDTLDSYFADAGRLIISKEKGSIGMLQRNFKIGFNRAARIMDQLEEAGVVGPEVGTKPRSVKMNAAQFEQYLNPDAALNALEDEYPTDDSLD